MVFESSALAEGGASYVLLTAAVALTIVGSVVLFVWMLAAETRRTCRRAPPPALSVDPLSAGLRSLGPQLGWTANPLSRRGTGRIE